MSSSRSRYPGLRPFDPEEKKYFFGRDEEIKSVCRLLDLDKLTILHGPSGMGKSSLINAGILPALGKIRNWDVPFHIIPIRFTNYDPELARIRRKRQGNVVGDDELVKDPLERFIDTCLGEDSDWEEVVPMNSPSLWLTAKKLIVDRAVHPVRLVFILDQFEELFTYPEERVEEFAQQLGELYHQKLPSSVRKGLERKQIIDADLHPRDRLMPKPKVAKLMANIQEPLDLKILISMRSDKLHFLERLKPYLPELMMNSYELRSFDLKQAKAAISQPAHIEEGDFISPEFDIDEMVLDELVGFLQDKVSGRIDPSQLQIVCQHIEQKIIKRAKKEKNN